MRAFEVSSTAAHCPFVIVNKWRTRMLHGNRIRDKKAVANDFFEIITVDSGIVE